MNRILLVMIKMQNVIKKRKILFLEDTKNNYFSNKCLNFVLGGTLLKI